MAIYIFFVSRKKWNKLNSVPIYLEGVHERDVDAKTPVFCLQPWNQGGLTSIQKNCNVN